MKSYIGKTTGEVGITAVIRKRLELEVNRLSPKERHVSLQLDEMALMAKNKMNKNWDQRVGTVNMGGIVKPSNPHALTNRLLAFVVTGLSTNFKIPVAFFFTKKLKATEQLKLSNHVILEVEKMGLFVDRVVGDNAATNLKMLKLWNNGALSHVVPHPCDKNRKLFLAFDSTHLLKNLRNQFIDRTFDICGQEASFKHIRKIYDIQKRYPFVRPARKLTRKHVEPNSLERQKVQWAVDIFSDDMIAALLTFKRFDVEGFQDIDATVMFMEFVAKWWLLHDISSHHQHSTFRNPDKKPFECPSDQRLEWLSKTFLPYLEKWKKYCKNLHHPAGFFTNETYQALVLTTKSNIEFIKYLLEENGFTYVLTRKFSTDNVERLFSTVRTMGGGNNKCDVTAATCAMDRIARTALVAASIDQNVPLDKETAPASVLIARITAGPDRKKERTKNLLQASTGLYRQLIQ